MDEVSIIHSLTARTSASASKHASVQDLQMQTPNDDAKDCYDAPNGD